MLKGIVSNALLAVKDFAKVIEVRDRIGKLPNVEKS
jgi:hypothetical protein